MWTRWARFRQTHQLAWALGLSFYALAALLEGVVALSGWSVGLYRVYFPLVAGLVGALGAGTIYLLRSRVAAHAFAAAMAALLLVAAVGQFAVPLALDAPVTAEGETRAMAAWGTDLGGKAVPFPEPARIAFLLLNVVGGLALIVGALWSWWQTRQAGVLLIGLGALTPFMGGSLSTLGIVNARVALQFVGVVVMFAGYLAGSAAPRARDPAASHATR